MMLRQLARRLPGVAASLRQPPSYLASCLNLNLDASATSSMLPATTFIKPMSAASSSNTSFCYQCEQTANGKGCLTTSSPGVCGKTPEVASLQDLLIYQLQGIAQYAYAARKLDPAAKLDAVDDFLLEGMFSTLTNVNFDATAFLKYLEKGEAVRTQAEVVYKKAVEKTGASPQSFSGPATLDLSDALGDRTKLETMGLSVGVMARKKETGNDDLHGLGEMCLYGLKGLMAYTAHAAFIGQQRQELKSFVVEALSTLPAVKDKSINDMLGLALKIGEMNLMAMETLDGAHRARFGSPEITNVRTTAVKGKCILVSGHDIEDLEEILKRTEGKGINVYTHGELLPANTYPVLKKYKHLIGNWGGPWQLQKFEFSSFPGAIVVTSNCLVEPQKRYRERIFTRRMVGWEGIPSIKDWDRDFSQVVDAASKAPGFKEDEPEKTVPAGFGHESVLGLADAVVGAIKSGDIKRFFLIGGCDGAEGERSYFRDLATNLPNDAVVLTLGCGKYRFNKERFETTAGGLPRMLDMGQCNDAYSAIKVAATLAKVFNTDVNSLPISFAVSWFEQKAVAVLLTLLHLNIKNIYLGPKLPAFATPNMLNILVKNYGIQAIRADNYDADLKQMLQGK